FSKIKGPKIQKLGLHMRHVLWLSRGWVPKFFFSTQCLIDEAGIQSLIAQRPPFFFLHRITENDVGNSITGWMVKKPNQSNLHMLEAMGQLGSFLLLQIENRPSGLPVFVGMNDVVFSKNRETRLGSEKLSANSLDDQTPSNELSVRIEMKLLE